MDLKYHAQITFDIGSNDKLSNLEKKAEKLVKTALTTSSAKPNSTIAEGNSDNGPEPKRKLDEPWHDTNWEYEIKNGHMLTNSSINMAQDILKKQFPAIKGLISTIDQYQTAADSGVNQLQIFHCRSRAHWIAASSIGSVDSVNVYDSVFSSLDNYSKEVVSKHFLTRSINLCRRNKLEVKIVACLP